MNGLGFEVRYNYRKNEYVEIFYELLSLKPGTEVFGPLPQVTRQSSGVISGLTAILLPKYEPEAVQPKSRPILKVIQWNDLLFEHYTKNIHNPEQMQKLQAVVRRILLYKSCHRSYDRPRVQAPGASRRAVGQAPRTCAEFAALTAGSGAARWSAVSSMRRRRLQPRNG